MAPFYGHYEVLLCGFLRIQGSFGEDNTMKIALLVSHGNFILHVICSLAVIILWLLTVFFKN